MLEETAADSRGGGAGQDCSFCFPPLPLMRGPTCWAALSPPIPHPGWSGGWSEGANLVQEQYRRLGQGQCAGVY